MIAMACRLAVAGLLLTAVTAKVIQLSAFQSVVAELGFRLPWSRIAAVTVIAVEAALGLALLVEFAVPVSALLAAGLFAVFNVVLVTRLWLGREGRRCDCFGGRSTVTWVSVCRNGTFFGLSIAASGNWPKSSLMAAGGFLVASCALQTRRSILARRALAGQRPTAIERPHHNQSSDDGPTTTEPRSDQSAFVR